MNRALRTCTCHRKRVKDSCSNIIPTLQAKLVVTKDKFLSNINNKQLLLNLLQDYLKNKGLTILCSTGDADVLMCREAAECCYSGNVSLLGEDTDLLVILLHMTKHHGFENKLYLTTKSYVYDIEGIRNILGQRVANSILLIHAFTGCDTTSRIFGVGKDRLLKILDSVGDDVINVFYSRDSTPSEVISAGENLMLLLLGMKGTSLNSARLATLEQKIQSTSLDIKCTQLPPTSAAAEHHSYRVFHQIQTWDEHDLNPTSWGWKIKNGRFFPVTTSLPIAPKDLLENAHCSCAKSGCNNSCSCRKAGLLCGAACLKCQHNCTNCPEEEGPFDV